jgi:hypothetical protein
MVRREAILGSLTTSPQEAAELPEDPNRERNGRVYAYLRNLRRPAPEGGGYVSTKELEQERDSYLPDIRNLRTLLINSPGGMAGGYWVGYLKRKYPIEYTHLRDIRGWHR